MYWFKIKDVCKRNEEKLYTLPPGFKSRCITATYYPDHVQVTYISDQYATLEEMLEKFHQTALKTGKSVVNFYEGRHYMSNGEKLYKNYVKRNKGCI